MPNRVVREDILTSDSVNKLSWASEIFYRRLMSVVDDFGRYDGRAAIIRSNLYPLKLNEVSEANVVKWMNECSETGLVSFYEVEGKAYLEILKFGQTLRMKRSKYPCYTSASRCIADDKHVHNARDTHVCLKGKESEIESESESEIEKAKKINEILNSKIWIDEISMKLNLTYRQTSDYLQNFLGELKLKDDLQKSVREIKSHFINWLKIQKEKTSAKKEKYGNSASNERVQRADGVAAALKKANRFLGLSGDTEPLPNSTEDGIAIVIESRQITGGGDGKSNSA